MSEYTWNAQKTHDFSGYTHHCWVHIQIELLDNDVLWNEEADISARTDGQGNPEKTFIVNYDLETDELSHPEVQFENQGNGWYLLNGDLDGTAGHSNDDNDAHMRIKVTDNYEQCDLNFEVKEYLENNNVPPGQEITFELTLTGGLSPFEYNLFPLLN